MNIILKSINYLLDITDIIYCLYVEFVCKEYEKDFFKHTHIVSVETYIFYILKNKLQRLSSHDLNVNLEKFGVN